MYYDSSLILSYAYEYLATYGAKAESLAMYRMFEYMDQSMLPEAALWMAVVQEIRNIQSSAMQ